MAVGSSVRDIAITDDGETMFFGSEN